MYEALSAPARGGENTLHPTGRMCAITRTAGACRGKVMSPSTLPATRSLDKRGRHKLFPRRPRFPSTSPTFQAEKPSVRDTAMVINCASVEEFAPNKMKGRERLTLHSYEVTT